MRVFVSSIFLASLFLGTAAVATAQVPHPGRVGVSVEGLSIFQQRNDVRIPPVGGTDFSIVDLIGTAPTPAIRGELTVDLTRRQEVRFVYAPIRVTGQGTPADTINFAGGTFKSGVATDAEYQFSSYRGTWRFRVHEGPTWTWKVGVTGFVRDARIALTQPGRAAAEDTDVGFVPLGHVRADARLSPRVSLGFELDGTAAPQGRAFDFSAALSYRPTPRWSVSVGYRTVEGGADVDAVYNFAWLNAVTVGTGFRF